MYPLTFQLYPDYIIDSWELTSSVAFEPWSCKDVVNVIFLVIYMERDPHFIWVHTGKTLLSLPVMMNA